MSDIEWGAEIEVNGVRPDWLRDDDQVKVWNASRTRPGLGVGPEGYDWDEIWAIRLPADHPYYTKGTEGYACLRAILDEAFDQAANGKGADRHAQGLPFAEQPMQKLIQLYGSGFALGQAAKKMQESQRMEPDAARFELLGAIVYIAGTIVAIDAAGNAENAE